MTQDSHQPPTLPIHQTIPKNKNQGNKHEHKHIFIRTVSSGFCLFCVGPMASFQMQVCLWNILPALSFLSCSTSETRTEKRSNPLREVSWTQTEPGWGWLSCTQGNVMTKQHIPQFSGGRCKPSGRGASLQCSPAQCHADTVHSSSLTPQPSGPQPHLLNWSTLHLCSAGVSKNTTSH